MTKELIEKLENKKILFTGATGMLGTAHSHADKL